MHAVPKSNDTVLRTSYGSRRSKVRPGVCVSDGMPSSLLVVSSHALAGGVSESTERVIPGWKA